MYSFYGGRPGNSFVIVTTYRSIAEMVARFKQGPSYSPVHFDEHVMINTVNKNDPDNGKIYRRGYQFTNDMGGAIYIGTIVGPGGKAPLLEMGTIQEVRSKQASEGYDERRTSGQYTLTGGNLVPGKTNSGIYNDAITWECCSVRNENDEDTTAYIGFSFPYTVIDYETSSIEPYASGKYADTSSAVRMDVGKHPFYEKWHINVPKGIKGDTLKNFRIITASSNVQSYDGQDDDVENNRQILVYDYYNYDTNQNGSPKTLYLGDYNMIEDISIADDGTINISYSHDNDIHWAKKLKWIKTVNLDTSTGQLTITYNHTTDVSGNATTYSTYLDWINSVNIADDGTVTFGHTHEADTTFPQKIKWCTGVNINDQGVITFNWNDESSTQLQKPIQWINKVALDTYGTLTVTYNTEDENDQPKTQTFYKQIKWINNISLNNEGTLTVTYNTSEQESFPNAIKTIQSITHSVNENANPQHGYNGQMSINYNYGEPNIINLDLLTGIEMDENGLVTAQWNNDDSSISELGSVNFIKDLVIDNNGNLLVQYSSKYGETTVNGEVGWTWLGKIAPYGNNTNMTISRILRGKHYIDTDTKTYLEFYIENVGLLRAGDTATISSGTATIYLNGTQVGTDPIQLTGIEIISNVSGLSTLNFKIELDATAYPTTNSPDLVDIELNNVVINVTRTNVADAVTNLSDQMTQINTNTTNISSLNASIGTINNNITSINRNINSTAAQLQQQMKNKSEFKIIKITSSSNPNNIFNSTKFSLLGQSINIHYNEYMMIIQGDIKPKTTLSKNVETDIFNFSEVTSLTHSFDNTDSPLTVITRGISGRNLYIDNKRIYFYDATYAWGFGTNNESVRLDLVIPFDLTT